MAGRQCTIAQEICRSEHAPGGVPTMVVNDDAGCLNACGDWDTIATVRRLDMLAPTGTGDYPRNCRINQLLAPLITTNNPHANTRVGSRLTNGPINW